MTTVKAKDVNRAISAVAKLGLFATGELKLTPRQFDTLWDDVTDFLGSVNDEKWRFDDESNDVRPPQDTLPGES